MGKTEMSLALAISEVVGNSNDYTSFMQWVYKRFENVIEEKCDKCQKDACPFVSIEGYIQCTIGNVSYSDLYKQFKIEEREKMAYIK